MATQKEINIERLNQAKAAGGVIPASNVVQPITPVTDNGTIGGAITTEAITSTPYTIPAPVNNTTARDRFTASATPVEIPQEKKTDTRNDVLSSIQNIVQEQGTQASFEEQAQIDNQLEQKRQTLNSLNAQALKVKNSYDRRIKELEKNQQGQFGGANQADIAKLRQEANEELANIAVQQAVAQGDVNTALTIIKDKVDAKFEPLKNQLETYKLQYQLLQDDMSESEKIAVQAKINERAAAIQSAENIANRVTSIKLKAIENGIVLTGETVDEVMKDYEKKIANTPEQVQLYSGLSTPTATAVRSQVSAFKTEPTVTGFSTIQEGRNFAKSISDKTENPADDQGLIYSLAKALDPGSVVREGEYATAQKYAQSWVKAYGKGIEQALLGTGFLSETARKNIKDTIEKKYEASKESYNNTYNEYAESINNLTGRTDGTRFLKDYFIPEVEVKVDPDKEALFDEVVGTTINSTVSPNTSSLTPKMTASQSIGIGGYTPPKFTI